MRSVGQNEAAEELSIRVLTFLTNDASVLSRFLAITGWTPQSLSEPESRQAILVSALDYLMREEDLLLTFAANAGVEPREISRALQSLAEAGETRHRDGAQHD